MKKKIVLVITTILLLTGLTGCVTEYCTISGCPKESASGSDYCYSHKCNNFSCSNKIVSTNYPYCEECLERAMKK